MTASTSHTLQVIGYFAELALPLFGLTVVGWRMGWTRWWLATPLGVWLASSLVSRLVVRFEPAYDAGQRLIVSAQFGAWAATLIVIALLAVVGVRKPERVDG